MEKIKTAVKALMTGAAGWKVYLAIIMVLGALLGATIYWFNSKLEEARKAGADAQQFEQVKADLEALKNVVDVDKESQDAIQQELVKAAEMRVRIDDLERMRREDRTRLDRLIRSAPEPALRAHATQAERDIEELERSRDGFAAEAVQASTAAWGHRDTMLARREAIRAQRGQLRPNPETKE